MIRFFSRQGDYIATVNAGLFNLFLSSLYHAMDSIPNLKPSEIQFYLNVLENVRDFGLWERFDIDVEAQVRDVRAKIRQVAEKWYEEAVREKQAQPGVNRLMTDEVEKATKGLDKRFPEPLLG